jgi:hypothetical protein
VPGVFAQYWLFPRKYGGLASGIYLLVWPGPHMARLFGTEFGLFFTYLGDILGWATLIGLIVFMVYQMAEERKAKKAVNN